MNQHIDPADALLAEDLITPIHDHDERRNALVARMPDGTHRPVTPAQAGAYVAEQRPAANLFEVDHADDGPRKVSRRHVLAGASVGLGAMLAASAGVRFSFSATTATRDLLVCIFLRGGFDGLSAVVPTNDPEYTKARPTTAVPAASLLSPRTGFGLNPNLDALKPMFDARQLTAVLGAGHPGVTRSHFDDMAMCERAAPANLRSGWLGRHLASSATTQGTFRAITIGQSTTLSLTTSFNTVAMNSIADFDVQGWWEHKPAITRTIDAMYGGIGGAAGAQADATLAAVDGLANLRGAPYTPANGAVYPDTGFGRGLRSIAQMAKGNKGLEVACIDLGDWDMHQNLGVSSDANAWFSKKATELAQGLAAFRTDMGPLWGRTTMLTMSEFGRRVAENGDKGVDHGHGNVMFVAGGSVNGGRWFGRQPSLAPGNLVQGDVPITTDYRQPLAEIVSKRLANGDNLKTVFPGYTPPATPLGIVRAS